MLKIIKKAPVAQEKIVHKDKTEETAQNNLPPVAVPEQHCTVYLSIGLTRNLGNYESMKLTVGITYPCAAEPADIDHAYATAKEWVDARVNELNAEIDEQLGAQ